MKINSLKIKNIRNIKYKEIDFEENNLIVGENATGKTTIAECIYFCCFYKSFRSNKLKDLINFNENNASIELLYTNKEQVNKININFFNNKKKFFFNEKEISNIYEIINRIKCILITPNNIDLINDNPSKRRKYLNIILSQNNGIYLKNLITYNKLLKIKNKVLKNYQKTNKIDLQYLNILNKKLNELDSWIIKERKKNLKKLTIYINEILKEITENKEQINIVYNNNFKEEQIDEIHKKELKYFKTLRGNHLDDFEFMLNEKNTKFFASQGQKRLITLCFFLSQKELDEDKDNYLLIFDDVSIDLDKKRQTKLINYLKNKNQIIYIATDILKEVIKQNENINLIEMI